MISIAKHVFTRNDIKLGPRKREISLKNNK